MDLKVELGGGVSNLNLSDLTLTGLDINAGATESTIDLSGDWQQDLSATIETGAAIIRLRLPKEVGVRVNADTGASMIETHGLVKDGNSYTNSAYGSADVTLVIDMQAGICRIILEVEE